MFLLDESGSMEPIRADTVGGVNNYMESIKDVKKLRFTLTKFGGGRVDVFCEGLKAKELPRFYMMDYKPLGCTPLFDAIGRTIQELEGAISEDDRAILVIMTDGEENASLEFNKDSILKLVEKKKGEGWEFVFLGATPESYTQGQALGAQTVVKYDSTKTLETISLAGAATLSYTRSGTTCEADWQTD